PTPAIIAGTSIPWRRGEVCPPTNCAAPIAPTPQPRSPESETPSPKSRTGQRSQEPHRSTTEYAKYAERNARWNRLFAYSAVKPFFARSPRPASGCNFSCRNHLQLFNVETGQTAGRVAYSLLFTWAAAEGS